MYAKRKSFMTDRGVKTRSQKTLELKKKVSDMQKTIIDYRAAYEQKCKEVNSLRKENQILEKRNNRLVFDLMQAEYKIVNQEIESIGTMPDE